MFRHALAILIATATAAPGQTTQGVVPPTRITVQMMPGITSSAQLPTQELIDARKALTEGRPIYTIQMRELADLGDGFAAMKFGDWLADHSETSNLSDVAHYYGIAAATARGGAMTRLINTLDRVEPSDLLRARSNVLENIMLTYARAGNSHAVEAVLRYQATGKPFGRIDAEVETLAAEAQGEAAAQIALHLAVQIIQNPQHTTADLERAQTHLEAASTTTSLETQIVASNLLPLLDSAVAQLNSAQSELSQ
ncbi:hypothetical protein DS901_12630 [Loktanella sp. D2R18]|uniref:hypothetical protein n=1 Tax=Rhodobacterales TaxID=204455 RepID=UPI000DE9C026|nr:MULTISPECIES: hypothetical protein [Rhodobacterales]MDO6591925.1 hypothetical protein [Yoonia sp. 1_MG-2023]RBW42643.1 hypothetical protein DS901_12630 [Loktanella sp. D2R18]